MTKIKSFINKYNWKRITFPSEKDDWKKMRKTMQQLFLMFSMLKKKKCILLMFQNIIQIVKKNLFFGCIDGCKNNPENSSTAKVSEHIPSGFSMSTISSFTSIENKCFFFLFLVCFLRFSFIYYFHYL